MEGTRMRLEIENYIVEVKGEEVITTMSNGRSCSSAEILEIIKLLVLRNNAQPADAEITEEFVAHQMEALTVSLMTGGVQLASARVRGSATDCILICLVLPDGKTVMPVGNLMPPMDPTVYYEANFALADKSSLN